MCQDAEALKIEADYQAQVRKAQESLDYSISKAKKDYVLLVNDYDAIRKARLQALKASKSK